VIYRNYRLREAAAAATTTTAGSGGGMLVDTPKSLVNDIRIASGYMGPLRREESLEECVYSSRLHLDNNNNNKNGSNNINSQLCPTTNVRWSEDASWKLACEGPTRIRQLLLGPKDSGTAHLHYGPHAIVPFDRCTLPTASEDDDDDTNLFLHHHYGNGTSSKDGSEDDVLSLCLEASHSAARIIHYADCTGKVITECITKAASCHPLIEFKGDCVVTDLIFDEDGGGGGDKKMVIGVRVLDKGQTKNSEQQQQQQQQMYATHGVVLASGGLGGIYQHSTNPLGFNALGSSVALALRLEDRLSSSSSSSLSSNNKSIIKYNGIVSDLEYVQFHPTSLFLPNEARFLLTEALRGEGAILRDASGRAFAQDYHPNGELAPRDIVARAVFTESQKSSSGSSSSEDGVHNAYLDISHRDSEWLKDRFPSIHAHLKSRANPMDFTKEKIPVIPAAHYTCGGVTTDLNGCVIASNGEWYGNLYAAGEAARTGLHGGNRLASTSLLEGLVYGASVGEMVAGVVSDGTDDKALENRERVMETMHQARYAIEQRLAVEQSSTNTGSSATAMSSSTVDEGMRKEATAILTKLKSIMWDNVGVVRTPSKLALAVSELSAIRTEADRLWNNSSSGGSAGCWEVVALRDAAYSGLAVAESALANRVSGGAHYVVLEESESENNNGGSKSDSDDEEPIHAVV